MNKRRFIVSVASAATLLAAGCSTTRSNVDSSPAAKRASIDADVVNALSRLYRQAPASRELVSEAKGVLVFPAVMSAGLIVGGSYGEGALLMRGEPVDYYKTAAGSVGLLAGAQSKALYILFMTAESLGKFRTGRGWTIGVDASIAMLETGASANVSSKTIQQPIIGYALTNSGLMANLSLDGTKFTKLDL